MWTRRRFLSTTATSAATLAIPIQLRRAFAGEEADLVLRITASPGRVPIWSGPETWVLRYRAEILKGRRDAVRPASSYLGPTLELQRGERVRIHFENRMNEPSIIHWHGMIVPEVADGHPHHAVGPGSEYIYDFTVRNPAGTYLYHPHPHGLTGKQVYYGLAGLLIVRERRERAYGLPAPEHELSLVIQDRRVGRDNQLVFKRMMMDDMSGVLGDTVLVNGVPDAAFKVSPGPYRLRLANVSNARIYKLAWSDGRPMRVIATDNGLLSSAEGTQTRPYVVLAPFERVELLEDFGERRGGAEVALVSQAYSGLEMMDGMMGEGSGGMMGGMMGRGMDGMMGGMMGPGQGEEFLIARFTVSSGPRTRGETLRLPEPTPDVREGRNAIYTQLAFRHMRGFFNGRRFDMKAVANDERLPLNEGTVWTFSNDGPGMPMPHPIHIHGVRFRIIERSRGDLPEDLREGLIDAGYKDTFLIFPGERVQVLVAPTEPGLFMYHCHNLEHEDGGMMRNCLFGSYTTAKG
jgi:FtsP/CotA-like multicopper oxidase with cupredoxin domain